VPNETGDQTGQESRSAGRRVPVSVTGMTSIESVTLEVADPAAAGRFNTAAFGLGTQIRLRASEAPATGFCGFTLSLTVSQPATVNGLIGAALDAGATPLKPAAKSFWGYGGVVQAPDGTLYGRRALARDAGVPPDGTGSHRLAIDSDAGPFTDPDGFAWEAAPL
jgi:hypothetical protein